MAFRASLSITGREDVFRATLCRCGHSKNKPFCDHSHLDAGFVATSEPATKSNEALAARDGALKVTPTKDGPYQVEGNLEICSGTGRVIEKTTKTWLCRCGGSANKPFCDGTHKKDRLHRPIGVRRSPAVIAMLHRGLDHLGFALTVFIAHCAADMDAADRLAKALERRGPVSSNMKAGTSSAAICLSRTR
ncbi:MAG: CDGSH iron-sulfur domain-containing protein [Alphaproteobacteria bacterium]